MANTERFETELPPELAQFVHSRIGQGSLTSGGDVVREAVRQAAELDMLQDAVRQKIAAGVSSLRAGKGVDGEAFMSAMDAGLAEQERRGR